MTLRRLRRFNPHLPRRDAPEARWWAAPRLVGEVAFTEWTDDRRLGHPTARGSLPDRSPDEVLRES